MRKRIRNILILLLSTWVLPALGAGLLTLAGSQNIRGAGGSYSVAPPWGWILDRELGPSVESDAVLYPKGTKYKDAPSVLYMTSTPNDGPEKLADLIKRDLSEIGHGNPSLKVLEGPPLLTRMGKAVPTKLLSGFKDGHFEALAYLAGRGFTVVLILSTSDEKILNEDLPALQSLVASLDFLPEQEGESGLG